MTSRSRLIVVVALVATSLFVASSFRGAAPPLPPPTAVDVAPMPTATSTTATNAVVEVTREQQRQRGDPPAHAVALPTRPPPVTVTLSRLACSRALARGVFWSWATQQCIAFDNRKRGVDQDDDDESGELVCRNSTSWLRTTSAAFANITAALPEPYRRFQQMTSYLFRHYRPWAPRPITVAATLPEFTATYNRSLAVHQLENFCVSPFEGKMRTPKMGGIRVRPFVYHDEAHGALGPRHLDRHYTIFVSSVDVDSAAARDGNFVLDARLAILFPIARSTRWNILHVTHRVLSLIGIMSSAASFHPDEADSVGDDDRPLLLLVDEAVEHVRKEGGHFTLRAPVLGFFLSALSVPFAVISAAALDESPAAEQAQQQRATYVYEMARATRHPLLSASEGAVLAEIKADLAQQQQQQQQRKLLCFQRGIAWSACITCTRNDPDEQEPYAFGVWQPVLRSPPKKHHRVVLSRLRTAILERCLAPQPPLLASSQSETRLPRVFFDLRSLTSRRIRSLGLMIEDIRDELLRSGVASEVFFREPWNSGSRREYVQELTSGADVFVSLFHGAATSQTWLLRPGSVAVEFASPHFYPKLANVRGADASDQPFLWFGAFSRLAELEAHWVIEVEEGASDEVEAHGSYFLPLSVIVQAATDAACRWIAANAHRRGDHSAAAPARCGNKLRFFGRDAPETVGVRGRTSFQVFSVAKLRKDLLAETVQWLLDKTSKAVPAAPAAAAASVSDVASRIALAFAPLVSASDAALERARFGVMGHQQHHELWSLIVQTLADDQAQVQILESGGSGRNCTVPQSFGAGAVFRPQVLACLALSEKMETECRVRLGSDDAAAASADCSDIDCSSCLLFVQREAAAPQVRRVVRMRGRLM